MVGQEVQVRPRKGLRTCFGVAQHKRQRHRHKLVYPRCCETQFSSGQHPSSGMEDMVGSFQASRSWTRFPSPVLGYGTSRGSLPIITSRRLIRPPKWKTSTRNQSLNIAGTRWTMLPTSPGSVIIPNRNSGPLVFLVPRYVLDIHLAHPTAYPSHPWASLCPCSPAAPCY